MLFLSQLSWDSLFLIVKNSQYKFLSLGFEIQKKADFFLAAMSHVLWNMRN